MTLTTLQITFAFRELVKELLKSGAVTFTKQELKQVIQDAEAWAETGSVKTDYNNNITAGNFKSNATADQKRLALIFALLTIIRG